MLIRRRNHIDGDIKSSEITDEAVYLDRRRFMRQAAVKVIKTHRS